jgi:hypothetical protein
MVLDENIALEAVRDNIVDLDEQTSAMVLHYQYQRT